MSAYEGFAQDAWHPVEISDHVRRGEVTLGFLVEQELALWRSASGAVHVWANCCAHRSVRLTLGLIDNDTLVCRYHGWRYGTDARCVVIPAHPGVAPPKAACAKAYSSFERDGVVWASLGEPAEEPPALPEGATYCRSHVVALPPARFMQLAPEAGFVMRHPQWLDATDAVHDGAMVTLVQPIGPQRTGVHVFALGAKGEHASEGDRQAAAAAFRTALRKWQDLAQKEATTETAHA